MLSAFQRGERKANNYLNDKEAIFRKHGIWLWYNEGGHPVYVSITFLNGVKTQEALQEKLKQHCGSGETANTPT